ncbi:hypothetical protein PAM_023 [Onion yellows phytoplasma OY-M]|uniref:ABC transmembrane type-1 domain-containing protein n=1 Tax=Onion yellows phytoplasma (strain OY-M) TaxID=262768 RepID=Q6YRJ1_ONYPE|nr:hypothetical protein PAM_023 [Onion yellows phytoplasma OY-M]
MILVVLFFTAVGPFINPLPKTTQEKEKSWIALLPLKIPFLEKFGIFDGTKKVDLYLDEIEQIKKFNPNIIKKQQAIKDNKQTVILDAYLYCEYEKSYINLTFTQKEYDRAKQNKSLIASTPLQNGLYRVKIRLFKYVFNKTSEKTYFYFGTTHEGNDLFTQVWKGSFISLSFAFIVSVCTLIIGTIIGAICGYYGVLVDLIVNSIVDFLSYLPFMTLVLVLMLKVGISFWTIIGVFLIKGWIGAFYYSRASFYRYKNKEYIISARMLGASDLRIMFKHIFPNIIGLMITSFALAIPGFILTEAVYSFVGVIKYPEGFISIGELLDKSFDKIGSFSYLLILPMSYLIYLMFAFNLLGNNLREAFDPASN